MLWQMNESTKAVFFSYASQDAGIASRICQTLRKAGIEVWLDQSELRGGDAWDAAIRKQIKACALFVPIISANTRARAEGYFRLEWKLAVDRSHLMAAERTFLLPLVIDDTSDADGLVPDKFREVQWTHTPAGNVPANFVERVLACCRRTITCLPQLIARPWGHFRQRPRATCAASARSRSDRFGGRPAVRECDWRPRDRLPERRNMGVPHQQALEPQRASCHLANVRLRLQGKEDGTDEIGRSLGVDALVLGSLAQRGPSLAITAELVSVRDATQLWGKKYARPADDMMQVEAEIAATIARTLRRQLSGEEKVKLARTETSDPEAYRLYLKGRDFLVGNQQEMDKSVDYFQQAVARAPDYAIAHAGLAEAYTRQAFLRAVDRTEAVGKARVAVTRALELDPDLAEARAALGLVRFYFEWDWAGADAEFRRALALNPGAAPYTKTMGSF